MAKNIDVHNDPFPDLPPSDSCASINHLLTSIQKERNSEGKQLQLISSDGTKYSSLAVDLCF